MSSDSIVAIDLGSNSFRLQIMTVNGFQLTLKESLKETVQLGAGLDDQDRLDEKSQQRALDTLSRFADRIRGMPVDRVRVVATNTLRVAKNAAQFLVAAEDVLGYPIEVISGFEEGRLIFQGAAHALPASNQPRFVVDVGGGSTEVILGLGLDIHLSSSLHMGCVSFSRQFFPEGKITKAGFEAATLSARYKLQPIADAFKRHGWKEVIGCSGTAKVLCELSRQLGYTEMLGVCVREAMIELKMRLIKAGNISKMELVNVHPDRARVLPGGLAILLTLCQVFDIEEIHYSSGALLLGVFYDHVGRIHHEDLRNHTVEQMVTRYHMEAAQIDRVAQCALGLYDALSPLVKMTADTDFMYRQMLRWACQLHEVGKTISISGYHRHSAYILRYSDMPGFSRQNQAHLALLVFAQRGKMSNIIHQDILEKTLTDADYVVILCLRLAVLCYRARRDMVIDWSWSRRKQKVCLVIEDAWLQENPLVESMLMHEYQQWKSMPFAWEMVRKK